MNATIPASATIAPAADGAISSPKSAGSAVNAQPPCSSGNATTRQR